MKCSMSIKLVFCKHSTHFQSFLVVYFQKWPDWNWNYVLNPPLFKKTTVLFKAQKTLIRVTQKHNGEVLIF
jgi:hypothetical protein